MSLKVSVKFVQVHLHHHKIGFVS